MGIDGITVSTLALGYSLAGGTGTLPVDFAPKSWSRELLASMKVRTASPNVEAEASEVSTL